jgi:hypothetical protein
MHRIQAKSHNTNQHRLPPLPLHHPQHATAAFHKLADTGIQFFLSSASLCSDLSRLRLRLRLNPARSFSFAAKS